MSVETPVSPHGATTPDLASRMDHTLHLNSTQSPLSPSFKPSAIHGPPERPSGNHPYPYAAPAAPAAQGQQEATRLPQSHHNAHLTFTSYKNLGAPRVVVPDLRLALEMVSLYMDRHLHKLAKSAQPGYHELKLNLSATVAAAELQGGLRPTLPGTRLPIDGGQTLKAILEEGVMTLEPAAPQENGLPRVMMQVHQRERMQMLVRSGKAILQMYGRLKESHGVVRGYVGNTADVAWMVASTPERPGVADVTWNLPVPLAQLSHLTLIAFSPNGAQVIASIGLP